MKSPFLSLLIQHLLILTIIFGTIYVVVEQGYRTEANDPQIQIARDIAHGFENKKLSLNSIATSTVYDIATTLSPFVVIYNDSGTPILWTGTLEGSAPTLPEGVLAYAKEKGENRITWQPRKNVRIAAVIKPFEGPTSGYVLVGRSLDEIEEREYRLALIVGFAWIFALVIDALCVWIRRKNDIL